VEDNEYANHRGTPEAVVGRPVVDSVFAGDGFAIVVQRDVKGVFGGDLIDILRRHVGAGAEFVLVCDLIVGRK
jgi:hypothetical protein